MRVCTRDLKLKIPISSKVLFFLLFEMKGKKTELIFLLKSEFYKWKVTQSWVEFLIQQHGRTRISKSDIKEHAELISMKVFKYFSIII